MKLQHLLSLTRKAVDEYQMIEENDRIAVGISGGKDSLTLLYALHGLRRFYPKPFTLHAVTVDLGFPGTDYSAIRNLCEELEIPYTVVSTEIAPIIFQERKEENPCSLCAKMRKGALNQAIRELGCGKVAYAHHRDDLVETMLLSLIYEGRFFCFSPKTYLDRTGLWVIRPMMFVDEADVIGFKHKYKLPVVKNPCPADGNTRRQYVKELLAELNSKTKLWVELGLQTAKETSAHFIRRGYDNDVFTDAVKRLAAHDISVVAHVIVGLPGETKEDLLETMDYINSLPIEGVKLQLLHVLEYTDLAELYRSVQYTPLTLEEYIDLLCACIARLRPDIVLHRLTGDGDKNILLAPLWSLNKRHVLNTIHKTLRQRNIRQGIDFGEK